MHFLFNLETITVLLMVPLVRFELTYYTPLFERGDFTKICPQGPVGA